MKSQASVLVGLLWCLALLAIVIIGILHTASLDLRIVKNQGDAIQAHYLALAGIEKAKALLYQDAVNRKRSAKNHTGELYDSPQEFRDVPLGRGEFSVFRQGRRTEGGNVIYGLADEESRININQASAEELGKLYGITPDVVAALVDYRDEDNAVTQGGAEMEYYVSLQPPYLPRNDRFQTLRELLMVRGVARELLFGEDANQNGLLDPEEDDGTESSPPDNHDGILDAGWSGDLTSYSSVLNRSAAGQDRVNVQLADESSLTQVHGISSDLAKAIIAYRGQNKLESLADLLEVRAMSQPMQPRPPTPNSTPGAASGPAGPAGQPPPLAQPANTPAPQPQPTGPPLISEELLMDIADDLTTLPGSDQPGAINVNTASPAVLACLPGISPELAQAIVSYRQSAGYLPNVAWLLKVPGMNRQILKRILPKLSARSETFRILSEGKVKSTGARKRIEVVVHLGAVDIDTLSYREDL
ncbi:MAG: helix-hairpin-helix domain-containing protein [Verrucomicrobiales bacterium]|nr:helix-hairpin-helix domain-containing protein [Verrucomicrobiales bacterium]